MHCSPVKDESFASVQRESGCLVNLSGRSLCTPAVWPQCMHEGIACSKVRAVKNPHLRLGDDEGAVQLGRAAAGGGEARRRRRSLPGTRHLRTPAPRICNTQRRTGKSGDMA